MEQYINFHAKIARNKIVLAKKTCYITIIHVRNPNIEHKNSAFNLKADFGVLF